ncbi:M23 family metallopeptidase [Streptomyces flavofungini]|uniref:M23 family metallopeptidase n=1 Tax=Streptomyces flavofungini TaxID=68200 RepID=UPI0025B0410B|nr:M23 family metallopeptidase [Streptomyces flavofungini]WJV46713.1 M23 family metallopeptidase [Streptomyces flavofungini]
MNDRHPSETPAPASAPDADYAPYGSYDQQGAQHVGLTGYDGYSTDSFSATGFNAPGGYDATGGFDTSGSGFAVPGGGFATDPLFGDLPGDHDTGQWSTTGTQQTLTYDAYAAQPGYDTGSHDTAAWGAGFQPLSDIPSQPGPASGATWDATAWNESPATGQWATQVFDTGAYDATAWNSSGHDAYDTAQHDAYEPAHQHDAYGVPQQHDAFEARDTAYDPQDGYAAQDPYETAALSAEAYASGDPAYDSDDATHAFLPDEAPDDRLGSVEAGAEHAEYGDRPDNERATDDDHAPVARTERSRSARSAVPRGRSRSRRSPAKRSALFTIAVPSACVMGVAGVAAASVSGLGGGDDGKDTQASAPDPATVKPSTANNKLDTQLANLSADAGDFADRASRTQERIDLKAQKVAAHKAAVAEAARKERLRPKFSLPVAQRGLSAYYGQAGVNWMSAHSGIDFPVSYGTEVKAATDGTVSTKYNSAYGNMAIVTAKDGTETWYCHLSTHKIASGPVKAGETIAFSGNSGNSTGPHLHFEVRPGGGSAIDPLSWLRSHGLDPT